ncbi:MAG TPA: adenylate/guanylate cyclase domain-containing protein [Candidatus Binatia bacterium]
MDDRTRLPFGVLATAATLLSLVSCYATRIELWIPALREPIANWVNTHVQAAIIVATAAAAVVGLMLDRKHHRSITPFAVGCAGFVLIAWSMYAPFGKIDDIVGFVLLVSAVFLNQTKALHALTLNLKSQNTEIERQHKLLEQQSAQLAEWNRTLSQRVDDQLSRIDRLGRLKRFFSPQLADLILEGNTQDPLKIHRREIAVVFLDLRGFTAFADRAEPEEVVEVLHEYHTAMGELIAEFEGTLERFTGDGIMVFFGDPIAVENPLERAVRLSLAMRDRIGTLTPRWNRRGYELGMGIGVSLGYATIGAIGFERRWDYAAIGRVTNLAARLCSEAQPGQILINQPSLDGMETVLEIESVGDLTLKGFQRPILVSNILGLKSPRQARGA